MVAPPEYPPDLYYGSKPLNIRFRTTEGGRRQHFCLNNRTLHLTDEQFTHGTYETGALLGTFCREFCSPGRVKDHSPCPAFVDNYMVGTENKGLATVEPGRWVAFDKCPGVGALLDMTETPEERELLRTYLEDKSGQESKWRDELISEWNECWHLIPEGWGVHSRREKFDRVMWSTMRFPALIPQVWLNWLSQASAEEQRRLDENPSRVDFAAFWRGKRHIVEIDGPSHYATAVGSDGYRVDEREYARNLKIARSLTKDGWVLTRIARIEIRDVMEMDALVADLEAYRYLDVLPFHHERIANYRWGLRDLDWVDVDRAYSTDDIPF
jgi:very-short-patch-repair endonuclease